MKYRCKNCGFIHLGELNDGYYCPYCLGSLFDFELIEEEEKKYKVKLNHTKENFVCKNKRKQNGNYVNG